MQSLIGPDPRVIADDIWAKLLWAGLNIGEEDFARTAKLPSFYPLSMIRALALVWLFAGLRGNEIMRLRVHHDQTKGEESRTLPLTGELFEVVKMQLEYTERYFPQCPLLFHREGRVRTISARHGKQRAGGRGCGKGMRIPANLRGCSTTCGVLGSGISYAPAFRDA
jgi:integrase